MELPSEQEQERLFRALERKFWEEYWIEIPKITTWAEYEGRTLELAKLESYED